MTVYKPFFSGLTISLFLAPFSFANPAREYHDFVKENGKTMNGGYGYIINTVANKEYQFFAGEKNGTPYNHVKRISFKDSNGVKHIYEIFDNHANGLKNGEDDSITRDGYSVKIKGFARGRLESVNKKYKKLMESAIVNELPAM